MLHWERVEVFKRVFSFFVLPMLLALFAFESLWRGLVQHTSSLCFLMIVEMCCVLYYLFFIIKIVVCTVPFAAPNIFKFKRL